MEDGDWNKADSFFEEVLNTDAKNALAYLGKLMAQLKVHKQEALKDCAQPFDGNNNYQKVLRFGEAKLVEELKSYVNHIKNRIETAQKEAERKAETDRKNEIYFSGKSAMTADTISYYEKALNAFRSIPGWRDVDKLIPICEQRYAELKKQREAAQKEADRKAEEEARKEAARKTEEARKENERKFEEVLQEAARKKRYKRVCLATIAAVIFAIIGFTYLLRTVIIPNGRYQDAKALLQSGDKAAAAIKFYQAGNCKDAKAQSTALWDNIAVRDTLSAGHGHTVGIKADSTVVAQGSNYRDNCDVLEWTDIVAISAGGYHTVGLKADGTVVAVGDNEYGQCDVSDWTDIVAISAGSDHTVGLKADGTVVATGSHLFHKCDVSYLTDIVAISAGDYHTIGLKADGTVVAVGNNGYEQCNVSEWTDIVAISTGNYHTVGLKKDGTVVAVGRNNDDQCEVSDWKDIKLP
jgi:hypothetical protein